MKKIIALALCVLMIFSCLVGCGKGNNENLANAVSYLENMYQTGKKDEPMKIETDKDVLTVVTVDGVSYTVEWTISVTDGNAEAVKIAESSTTNCVKIDVPELPEADILFTATATVKDEDGNTATATFNYKVFGLTIDNGDASDDTSSEEDTSSDDNTSSDNSSTDGGSTQLSVVTDQAKILKDAFALGKNKTTPYIAVLTGKVISITKEYNEQYGSITAIISVGGKNITCYNMKVGSVSGGSKLKPGDTITVKGVIKNFYYDEADSSGTVEFTWDEASQTEVVLTKLEASKEVEKTLSIVDNPTVGTAYKFGLFSTAKNATYYAAGGMGSGNQKYYMATTTSSAAAIDVYLEATTGGYYLYTKEGSAKKYLNIQPNAAGTHINAVYTDKPDMVFVYDSEKKTLVTSKELTKGDKSDKYVFGTYGDYFTIGASGASHDDTYYCRFYK